REDIDIAIPNGVELFKNVITANPSKIIMAITAIKPLKLQACFSRIFLHLSSFIYSKYTPKQTQNLSQQLHKFHSFSQTNEKSKMILTKIIKKRSNSPLL